jgi:SseB protein N-terminal domain
VGEDSIEQLIERAAKDNSPRVRQDLFRAIKSVEVFFPYKVEQQGGKEIRSSPLARLSDGTHAMMLFTSKSHPALSEHDRFAGGPFEDALAAALKMPPLDWVFLWNAASDRVVIAKVQIPEILANIESFPQDHDGRALEKLISNVVRSDSQALPASIESIIGGRELFLELSKDQSEDVQPAMKSYRVEHLAHVIRAYTSRIRPGLRYGGITWQALKEMISGLPEIGGVQLMNNADDWIVFDREALDLRPSATPKPDIR